MQHPLRGPAEVSRTTIRYKAPQLRSTLLKLREGSDIEPKDRSDIGYGDF